MTRLIALVLLLSAPMTMAQTLSGNDAKSQLFSTRGTSVQISGALSQSDQAIMRKTVEILGDQLNRPVQYYASIAYSPDEGLLTDALQSAMNYHTVEAADRAAINACNNARKSGTRPCQIAARILPRNYEPRALTLSLDATSAFDKVYQRKRGAKVFAISPATGAYGIGDTAVQAIATCGKQDCEAVIID